MLDIVDFTKNATISCINGWNQLVAVRFSELKQHRQPSYNISKLGFSGGTGV